MVKAQQQHIRCSTIVGWPKWCPSAHSKNSTIGRVSYLIYVSMRHYVLTTSGDIVVCFHTAVCLSCEFVNYIMAFSICYWENYTQWKTKLSWKSENAVVGGWLGFVVFVWHLLTSCWILSPMSPEIQEWSHKSRSRINNLYLLTRPIHQSTFFLPAHLSLQT